jgi:hypothetical protein
MSVLWFELVFVSSLTFGNTGDFLLDTGQHFQSFGFIGLNELERFNVGYILW